MPVVVVANPKGGVGKSTLATNIAGYFASRGGQVMLDVPQIRGLLDEAVPLRGGVVQSRCG